MCLKTEIWFWISDISQVSEILTVWKPNSYWVFENHTTSSDLRHSLCVWQATHPNSSVVNSLDHCFQSSGPREISFGRVTRQLTCFLWWKATYILMPTKPWWPSGLACHSIASSMLEVKGSNPAVAVNFWVNENGRVRTTLRGILTT